ncbi:MAG: HAMP domain-containing sensor histidine kinase [Acidimicrobiia bacterium]|nr:HAMP domain-containing sensor histidine kinase [Acidimicrobiia bacterium]MDX2468791.1 HAMP domain-containing sensor histidine kinase [Acidimicrobiia bacterium]
MQSNWLGRRSPRVTVALSVAVYVLMVPVFWQTKGTYGIFALLPVTTISLLYGRRRGALAGATAFAVNVAVEYVAHGYSLMLTTASGVVGNTGMIGLGWLVGYLRDLSQSRLQQVVEEKDRLIGTISHELRTPLSTVVGLSHELADRAASFTTAEVAEFCGLIAQQSAELEALIEDLLVAARADIERIKVLKVPVDLEECVTRAVAVATEGWPSPSVTVRNESEVARPAYADSLRVRQIVRNLLQNAHRYGGSDIEVLIDYPDNTCVITVSDDGTGVPSDGTTSIFEPHVRMHPSNGSTDSLGLGLYVSRTLAKLMNGTLEYRRDDDRTCFDLVLPAVETEMGAPSSHYPTSRLVSSP